MSHFYTYIDTIYFFFEIVKESIKSYETYL